MTWFETLTGFREESPEQVCANLTVEGNTLRSNKNGRTFVWGELEISSLAELREQARLSGFKAGEISVREVLANVQDLHRTPSNAGSLFQVASQFNLLEMVSPESTPEDGVGRYEQDHTQGPACAIAAGAGTIYRNYFAPVNGEVGQSAGNQIDCLAGVGAALRNSGNRLWEMRNGYALATREGLMEISEWLQHSGEEERDYLRGLLRIGIQWNPQVTLENSRHTVSQAYCSALPVSYSRHDPALWADFARLILEGAYEATLCAALLNSVKNGNNRVFLTSLGGGAFGNKSEWIVEGIRRALDLYRNVDLDVVIVSYSSHNQYLKPLLSVK